MLDIDARTVALFFSVGVAAFSIHRNTIINRRRATVDLVLSQKGDEKLNSAIETLKSLSDNKTLTRYISEENAESEEFKAILTVLNNYEFIAVGISQKAFDKNLYQRMQHVVIVRNWRRLKPLIYDLRETRQHPTLFQDFEALATQFIKKPLKPSKKH